MTRKNLKIAVIGATGLVGQVLIKELEKGGFNFEVDDIIPYASGLSEGKFINFRGERIGINSLKSENIENVDIAFFCADEEVSKQFAKKFIDKGVVVIDNSSAFRLDAGIPLVVPEVNADDIGDAMLIANPNCSTIQLVVALSPLMRFGIKRVFVTTYQAISGAGRDALSSFIEEWEDMWDWIENKSLVELVSEHPYADFVPPAHFSNVVPQIGNVVQGDLYKEEYKIIHETRKILNMPDLNIHVTAVRVPVINAHSESVFVEFGTEPSLEDVKDTLSRSEGIEIIEPYPTPVAISGKRKVYIGRIRQELDEPNIYHLFVVADNLRKGAATNALQIAGIIAERF